MAKMSDFDKQCLKDVKEIAEHITSLADERESLYEYLKQSEYDIEWRLDIHKDYKSVKVMIACSGPNIFVDTNDAYVKLYWGNTQVEAPFSYKASDLIDEIYEEEWGC